MKRHAPPVLTTTLLTLGLAACGNTTPADEAGDTEASETMPETVTVTDTATDTTTPPPTTTSRTTSPTSTGTPGSGECSPEALARDIAPALDTVMYCDGQWLRGGKWQTDWVVYARWDNGRWVEYEEHGTSSATGFPCFHLDRARADGAPEEIVSEMLACEQAPTSSVQPN